MGVDADLSWPLARAAALHGARTAIVDGERRVDYATLAARVAGLGGGLQRLETARGDRVALLADNGLEHTECWLGVPAHGRVLCDLNHRLAAAELQALIDDCGARVLLVDDRQLQTGRALREACPGLDELVHLGPGACPRDCVDYAELVAGEAVAPPGDLPRDTPAAISYTGGTTGRPKGVTLSHGNLVANAQHNLAASGHRTDDVFLHVCPMFHVAGTSNVFAATWVGAEQLVLPRFEAGPVAAAIAGGVTMTSLVPTMLAMLVDELEQRPVDVASLRSLHYAASPIGAELQRRVAEAFPGAGLSQFYGMTEAAPTVSHCTPEDHRRGLAGESPFAERLASIGAALPGVQARVCDIDGRALPAGEVGELRVRGPNVMLGYWGAPEATAAVLRDGWYLTGDAARADADGYLYLVDRLKDMIVTGGENVYSIEVEAALLTHPGVAEAAVFGVPHERWGEAVHAVVVLREDASVGAEELAAHCRAAIAGFKLPRTIELRDEPLPKSGPGKVLKGPLREPHWRGHTRRIA